ncbi:hypothetical protein K0M31_002278 [Melipona bicolor]|uniref:Uncharacterized protein n=1 Tax=Melipona bicolor TaxID=60889 RepID=A0AA40GHX9_9HYME|nr:hypothetical protein K0M31_002278 [Melipona bicolor]
MLSNLPPDGAGACFTRIEQMIQNPSMDKRLGHQHFTAHTLFKIKLINRRGSCESHLASKHRRYFAYAPRDQQREKRRKKNEKEQKNKGERSERQTERTEKLQPPDFRRHTLRTVSVSGQKGGPVVHQGSPESCWQMAGRCLPSCLDCRSRPSGP